MSRQITSTNGKVFRAKFRNQADKLYLVAIGSANSVSQEAAKLALMQAYFPKCTETNYDIALYHDDLREFGPGEEVRANSTVYLARVPATERKVWLSAAQKEQLEAAKNAKADPRPSFEEASLAWKREMRRWQTTCRICHQKNTHTTSECFYNKNFVGAKRASGIPRSMLQAVAPGTSNVVVDTFGVASQTRVQAEAYREAERRRYQKVNHHDAPAKAARNNKMFCSTEVPDSLKCPACEKMLCVPQKMTPCGCVVCFDCSESVRETQMENMKCHFCKKLLHETPDYVYDEEAQTRMLGQLNSGSSSPSRDSGVSSDDSQERSSTTESTVAEVVTQETVRAPKRKAETVVSKEVAPPSECGQRIEVVSAAKWPRISLSPPPRSDVRVASLAQPQPRPVQAPDFDPLAAFNDFLASKDKRDKYVKGWLQESNRRRDELRSQRHHYYKEDRSQQYYRPQPYYRR